MTREEAIKIFNTVLFFGKCDCPKEEIEECLKMAIEALKQEPCNDCISREAAIRLAEQGQIQGFMWQIQKLIGLPPVQPKQEPVIHARWISVPHKKDRICSRCVKDEPYKFADIEADVYEYCPHCGAKMDEGDEE